MARTDVSQVVKIEGTTFLDDRGNLASISLEKNFPWIPVRIFTINTKESVQRGFHAHKICNQAFIKNSGDIRVTIKDGNSQREIDLNFGCLLLIPNGIWVELEMKEDSAITVLCNKAFAENDYIRNWAEFISMKGHL